MAQSSDRSLKGCVDRSLVVDGERILRLYMVRPLSECRGAASFDRAVDTREWQDRVRRELPSFRMYNLTEQFYMGAHRESWELVRFDKQTKSHVRLNETILSYRKKDTRMHCLSNACGTGVWLLESWQPEEQEFPNFENIAAQRRSVMQFRYPRNALVGVDINFVRNGPSTECFLMARYNQFNKDKVIAALEQALERFFTEHTANNI